MSAVNDTSVNNRQQLNSIMNSSLHKATLSATNFQFSQLPCKNKALADQNADLRARVAQLVDEKEKWQIKYCNLNMKISDFDKYRKDVTHLLQKMSFYLQNFLVVRDMLVRMLQQEADFEETEVHNTKAKQKAVPEQVPKDYNNQLMRQGEQKQKKQQQQQQQHISQSHLQNPTVDSVLQSSMRNQMQICVSENDGEHRPKDKTGYQPQEIQEDQLVDFSHFSQHNKVYSVSEDKPLQNMKQEETQMNEAMQKSRLSNKMQGHQGMFMDLSSGNDSLQDCSSFQNKSHRKGQDEQLLKHNKKKVSSHQVQESCPLEYECLILESQQHVHGHLPQVQNMSPDKNLKLNLPQGQLVRLQQVASQNCYPPQQSLIKGQQESVKDQFDEEKISKANKQRTIHIKEKEHQELEEQELEDKGHKSLESDGKILYCEGVQQQHAGLQGNLQTEHEHLNTVIQKQQCSGAQRPSFSDVQGQITVDKAQQVVGDQDVQVTLNQGIKLTVDKEEVPINKELQFTHNVDHPLTSDRKQLIPKENRHQVNIHKPLQTVEEEAEDEEVVVEEEGEEKRKSVKSEEYLVSANAKLHSKGRDRGLTGNQETSVGIRQQLPVKMCHLFPASVLAELTSGEGRKLYWDKGKLPSSESKQQLSPEDKELSMVQRHNPNECGEEHIANQLSEKQVKEHNLKGQLISIEVQQQKKIPPPFAHMKDLQQPADEQNQQLDTVHGMHFPHCQFNGEAIHQSAMEKESCIISVQTVMGKEQSNSTEHREDLTTKRDQPFTARQEHQSRTGKEHQMTTNKELYTTTDDQQFATGQKQYSVSNKLQQCVGNKNHKLTKRQINHVASDNEIKLKAKNRKQLDKEKGLVPDTEPTRQFPGEHVHQTINKMPKLSPRSEQRLSHGNTILDQGQQQHILKQDQQLEEEQGHQPTGEQSQLSVVEEVEGLAASCYLSTPESYKQPVVERAQQRLVERGQQKFTKHTLELSAELSQEILVKKIQDTVMKEVKWLPSEQYQWLVTKEWKLKGQQGQSSSPHCEKELLEHSSVLLLSDLSKTGFETSFNSSTHSILRLAKKTQQTSTLNTTVFETSCNSSTQSVLRCARKIRQKSTLNNSALHRSYTEDSIIKRIPAISEAPMYKTLENYKL